MCDIVYSEILCFSPETIFYKIVRKTGGKYYSPLVKCELPINEWLTAENIDPRFYPEENYSDIQQDSLQPFCHAYHEDVCGFSVFSDIVALSQYGRKIFHELYNPFYLSTEDIVVECYIRGKITKARHGDTTFYLGEEIKLIQELSLGGFNKSCQTK